MKKRLMDIDEKFFEKIAKDEAEQEMIRARGQLQMESGEPGPGPKDGGSSIANKVVIVNFAEGNYTVTNTQSNATYQFQVEAGGILTSD